MTFAYIPESHATLEGAAKLSGLFYVLVENGLAGNAGCDLGEGHVTAD